MERIVGIAASEGYAIGRLYIHLEAAEDWSHQTALDPDQEVSRFQQAKEDACIELGTVYHRAVARVGEHHSGIFKIHLALLRDDDFCKEVSEYIQQNHCTAEKGVQEVGQKFFRIFEEMDDDYLRARGADVKDIVSRLLFFLGENRKEEMGDWLPKGAQGILAAEEIMPSQTIRMDVDQVTGLITRTGSRTSHSAILARSLQIPAVTGLGKQFDLLRDGSCVILDGFKGLVIQDPDEETLSAYQRLAQEYENQQKALESYKGMKAVTQDGTVVELCANIGHPNDLDEVLDNGADGVGLFRTEFLFMYWGPPAHGRRAVRRVPHSVGADAGQAGGHPDPGHRRGQAGALPENGAGGKSGYGPPVPAVLPGKSQGVPHPAPGPSPGGPLWEAGYFDSHGGFRGGGAHRAQAPPAGGCGAGTGGGAL